MSNQTRNPGEPIPDIKLSDLSVREKIGQTVVLLSGRAREIEMEGSLEAFLAKYPVGGFFVGAEIIKDVMTSNSFEQVKEATEQYQSATKIPLIFASDLENGCGSMIPGLTKLPFPMALGAAKSEQLAYDYGKATALEARLAGVNWTFSPVADLNVNRFNPITCIRAISDKPSWTIPLLKAVVRGMQDHGLAATAKHFPGDGCDYRDQHLTTTVNSLSREEWLAQHGAVFQALIDDGLASIMTGHISLPSFQSETVLGGRFLPATLSAELSDTLLKRQMGFKGAIVSDALIMGGYLKWYERSDAYLRTLKAGTDLMLWPELTYFETVERALETGELTMERLDDAVERVLRMKRRFGVLASEEEPRPVPVEEEDSAAIEAFASRTSQQVAERSLTLVRDEIGLLPAKPDAVRKVLIVGITPSNADYEELSALGETFKRRGIEAETIRGVWYEDLIKREPEFDLIVYAPILRHHHPMGPLAFSADEASACWSALTAGRSKSVVVSFGSPYVIADYFDMAPVAVNAYSNVPSSHEAFVRALLGEIPFAGVAPVDNL
ncbi:glycoside hydrolase family 3 protein [Cohnella thailandensis]|uniref:beta-N-acetylhexosaminidase n=1 Tax=Cohnella thailandensis TaxID=557557 RepID=A0A841T727_9BACL|nr:glycoside hydrolase family 3 N-terminal domain-containing protein [Cohnella thailandensis]MBB6637657.1 glycoside hydrolase family 3 protein [Cohnella thailandensis]MBP1974166.1 beta-N-acetylhexosaminidase [Cohnella thailandensis]